MATSDIKVAEIEVTGNIVCEYLRSCKDEAGKPININEIPALIETIYKTVSSLQQEPRPMTPEEYMRS